MSRQQGTGLPGSEQGLGSTKGRRNNPDQSDQKLTDEWKSQRRQDGSGEQDLQKQGEQDVTRKDR